MFAKSREVTGIDYFISCLAVLDPPVLAAGSGRRASRLAVHSVLQQAERERERERGRERLRENRVFRGLGDHVAHKRIIAQATAGWMDGFQKSWRCGSTATRLREAFVGLSLQGILVIVLSLNKQ